MTEHDDGLEAAPASLQELIDNDLDGLLDAPEKPRKTTSADRLQRAFLEIVDFRRAQGRLPSSTTRDIAERRLGARLDGILADDAKLEELKPLDEFGMLEIEAAPSSLEDLLSEDLDDLLGDESGLLDVSDLPVRRSADAPESVAKREKAEDFDKFEHLFKAKHAELADGTYALARFPGVQSIEEGNFFVLNGVMLFIAEVGETTYREVGGKQEQKQRLRVIFENGTESRLYRQSLSIRLHEQDGLILARTGLDPNEILDGDAESGYVYVLQSLSDDPAVSGLKDLHKIGFSTTSVEQRVKNAEKSPTYLMAPVKILATYKLYNMRASWLEHLLHRVFAEVRLDITQIDRKGRDYDPSEWFVVPLPTINQAISMIMSGEITDYVFDRAQQRLVQRDG
ncbi:GIY-YIG nuclease family protein [Microbacterium esteraromaticum]|uniref:GIY-YIG nuclease family protein n=1 Tax=Microbacterium esteraromaticum TaxID=57043 RepID=UPI001A8D9F79|nr:GIY-YIG nuclease family protein [Microbacterium esteraromaticum]MBN8423091.1 GIY-YIG nuclease family protein [Microbacterium esteraromaticum]